MALEKQFSRKLDQLWQRRTAGLRSLVISQGSGKLPQFTRKVRERLMGGLLDDATALLLKREGRSEFKKLIEHRHLRQIRGHGLLERGDNLTEWAARKLRGPIVYAFWRGRKCLYVGKGRNWKRLRAYSKSHYLYQAGSIEVFRVRGRSQLAKAECLAT